MAMVIDHIGYAVSDTEGDHTLIAADDFIDSSVILGNKKIEASQRSCLGVIYVHDLDVRLFGCMFTMLMRCNDTSVGLKLYLSLLRVPFGAFCYSSCFIHFGFFKFVNAVGI